MPENDLENQDQFLRQLKTEFDSEIAQNHIFLMGPKIGA